MPPKKLADVIKSLAKHVTSPTDLAIFKMVPNTKIHRKAIEKWAKSHGQDPRWLQYRGRGKRKKGKTTFKVSQLVNLDGESSSQARFLPGKVQKAIKRVIWTGKMPKKDIVVVRRVKFGRHDHSIPLKDASHVTVYVRRPKYSVWQQKQDDEYGNVARAIKHRARLKTSYETQRGLKAAATDLAAKHDAPAPKEEMKTYNDFKQQLHEKHQSSLSRYIDRHPYALSAISGAAFGAVGGAALGGARGAGAALKLMHMTRKAGASVSDLHHIAKYAKVGAMSGAAFGAAGGASREAARAWGLRNQKKHPVASAIASQDKLRGAVTVGIAGKNK